MYEIKRIQAGCNCYLVTQGENTILIDAGIKGKEKKILKICREKNVRLILLTHGHMDHIQNATYLSKQLQVPVAMHNEDLVLLQDNLYRGMKSKGLFGGIVRFFSVVSVKNTKSPELTPEIFLKEGDDLTEYGIEGKIIELPGHTEGSIGVLLGEQYLLVGDALMNMFGPGVSLLFENREKMLHSAKKISELGDRLIYFGHGAPVKNRKW